MLIGRDYRQRTFHHGDTERRRTQLRRPICDLLIADSKGLQIHNLQIGGFNSVPPCLRGGRMSLFCRHLGRVWPRPYFPATISSAASPRVHTGSIRYGGGALEVTVSLTPIGEPRQKITAASLRDKKRNHEPITCLTAYDYATARLVDEAGIDVVLVGDSLAMTMLGYENTLSVTVEEMLHHTRAVRRGVKNAFLVADMPYGSYHVSADEALRNAARFIKE